MLLSLTRILELAQSFIRDTGANALACSFGTVHGNIYFHDIALWGRQSMAATYEDAMRIFKNQ